MYLENDSFGGGTYPKTFFELNCTSNGFSYNFLNLAVLIVFSVISLIKVFNQSLQLLT
jgi:hypothetical protein